jgi:hypothetical protein
VYLFQKYFSDNKDFSIQARRVNHVYALIPNIAVLWFERESIFGNTKECGLHFEWLSFTITVSLRTTGEDDE